MPILASGTPPATTALDRVGVFYVVGRGRPGLTPAEIAREVDDTERHLDETMLQDGWYVKSARLGAQDLLEKGLQLEAGNPGGRIEVVVSSVGAQLEGSVSGHDGPVIGARVSIAPEPETPYNRSRSHSEKTDQRGHFVVTGLAPGTYRLRARYSEAPGKTLRSDPQTVTLSERDHKTLQVEIAEPPPSSPRHREIPAWVGFTI